MHMLAWLAAFAFGIHCAASGSLDDRRLTPSGKPLAMCLEGVLPSDIDEAKLVKEAEAWTGPATPGRMARAPRRGVFGPDAVSNSTAMPPLMHKVQERLAGLIVSLGDHQVELNRIGVTWICSPSQVPAEVRFHFHNDWEKEHNTSPVSPRSIVVPLRQEQLPHSHTLIRIGNSSNISCTSTKRGSATYMVVAANSSRPSWETKPAKHRCVAIVSWHEFTEPEAKEEVRRFGASASKDTL